MIKIKKVFMRNIKDKRYLLKLVLVYMLDLYLMYKGEQLELVI